MFKFVAITAIVLASLHTGFAYSEDNAQALAAAVDASELDSFEPQADDATRRADRLAIYNKWQAAADSQFKAQQLADPAVQRMLLARKMKQYAADEMDQTAVDCAGIVSTHCMRAVREASERYYSAPVDAYAAGVRP